jgi:uncharacterized membrane protein
MKPISRFACAAMLMVFLLAISITVEAQDNYNVQSTQIKVYRDGLARITQTATMDELIPEITIPLLSSSVENLIILDSNQIAVDFYQNDTDLTIFTLGTKQITIEYDTAILTSKQADVWTIIVNCPYDLTLLLPQNSTIIYLNQLPQAIGTTLNEVPLSLNQNQWEISYIIPLQQDGNQQNGPANSTIPIEYLIVAILTTIIILIILTVFLSRKRKINIKKTINRNPTLTKDDIAVVNFLAEKDGKAFEAEIRQRFPEMPRTSLWRLVRRLEGLEIVEIKRIGLENQVQLLKK